MRALGLVACATHCSLCALQPHPASLQCWTTPGDELLCSDKAHVYLYEGGGIAFNSGAPAVRVARQRRLQPWQACTVLLVTRRPPRGVCMLGFAVLLGRLGGARAQAAGRFRHPPFGARCAAGVQARLLPTNASGRITAEQVRRERRPPAPTPRRSSGALLCKRAYPAAPLRPSFSSSFRSDRRLDSTCAHAAGAAEHQRRRRALPPHRAVRAGEHHQQGRRRRLLAHLHAANLPGAGAATRRLLQPRPTTQVDPARGGTSTRDRADGRHGRGPWPKVARNGPTQTASVRRRVDPCSSRAAQVCREQGLKLHLDGARVFNALAAARDAAAPGADAEQRAVLQDGLPFTPLDLGGLFDSISICLSKGLGCPVGSLLLGAPQTHTSQAVRCGACPCAWRSASAPTAPGVERSARSAGGAWLRAPRTAQGALSAHLFLVAFAPACAQAPRPSSSGRTASERCWAAACARRAFWRRLGSTPWSTTRSGDQATRSLHRPLHALPMQRPAVRTGFLTDLGMLVRCAVPAPRLSEDHGRARRLGQALQALPGAVVASVAPVSTNIVIFTLAEPHSPQVGGLGVPALLVLAPAKPRCGGMTQEAPPNAWWACTCWRSRRRSRTCSRSAPACCSRPWAAACCASPRTWT